MRIYYHVTDMHHTPIVTANAEILRIVDQSGIDVVTNMRERATNEPADETSDGSPLQGVDAVIVEGSGNHADTGFVLASAIAQKKPILLLLQKHIPTANPLGYFGKKLPAMVRIVHYEPRKLEAVIMEFLASLENFVMPEMPTIKFTLRITPQIERYLHWKTHNTKLTKADFLRKIVTDDVIAGDKEYQSYICRKKPR